jgi:peptidoglycan/xylan/chitin deacetylase (PgdA/CDA1 family)
MLMVRGAGTTGAVFLTFDDGPHPEHTPHLLDVLEREGVQATFFVVGQQAERYPDLVDRITSAGHTLGHHSYFHADPNRTSARQLAAEVRRTSALLAMLLGRAPTLFRPPHGKVTTAKLIRLWCGRQTVVLWNVDPRDYAATSGDELRAWFAENPLVAGDIVLLHDVHPHAAAAIPDLARRARQAGLAMTGLPRGAEPTGR